VQDVRALMPAWYNGCDELHQQTECTQRNLCSELYTQSNVYNAYEAPVCTYSKVQVGARTHKTGLTAAGACQQQTHRVLPPVAHQTARFHYDQRKRHNKAKQSKPSKAVGLGAFAVQPRTCGGVSAATAAKGEHDGTRCRGGGQAPRSGACGPKHTNTQDGMTMHENPQAKHSCNTSGLHACCCSPQPAKLQQPDQAGWCCGGSWAGPGAGACFPCNQGVMICRCSPTLVRIGCLPVAHTHKHTVLEGASAMQTPTVTHSRMRHHKLVQESAGDGSCSLFPHQPHHP
jgi:hypothetical protein